MKALKKLNVNKVAAAIEADAGQALPGLRESLAEARPASLGARTRQSRSCNVAVVARPAASRW